VTRLTPARRSALIARAKRAAVPVASCVAASISPAHIVGGMSRDELLALVVVLAEAADPVRLRTVVQAADDGLPGVTDLELQYRAAHAEAVRLRTAGLPVPLAVRALDSAYRRSREQADRGPDEKTEAA
jgi:hypothetical protein